MVKKGGPEAQTVTTKSESKAWIMMHMKISDSYKKSGQNLEGI